MKQLAKKQIRTSVIQLIASTLTIINEGLISKSKLSTKCKKTDMKTESDTHDKMMRAIGNIEGGINGINARLDKLNGSVGENTKRITALEISDGKQNLKLGIFSSVAGALGGFLLNQFK